MDAEVYWDGRLVGHLRGVRVDQPYYRGEWRPAGDPEFARAFAALQARVGAGGLGVLPVTLRSPDGRVSAAAGAVVRPAPERDPYFRFGSGGEAAGVVVQGVVGGAGDAGQGAAPGPAGE
jgi:hypothetical protein